MASEITVALIGLGGAIVGGGLALIAPLLQYKYQARADRLKARREGYQDLIRTAYELQRYIEKRRDRERIDGLSPYWKLQSLVALDFPELAPMLLKLEQSLGALQSFILAHADEDELTDVEGFSEVHDSVAEHIGKLVGHAQQLGMKEISGKRLSVVKRMLEAELKAIDADEAKLKKKEGGPQTR